MNKIPNIRQRGKSFAYTLDLGKDEDGKRNRVTHGGFNTHQEAMEHVITQTAMMIEGKLAGTSKELLESFIRTWFGYKRRSLRPATIKGNEAIINNHIIPLLGHKRILNIGIDDIRDFYMQLDKKHLSSGTAKNIRRVLSECLDDAVKKDIIQKNPARMERATVSSKRKKSRFQYWEEHQWMAFLKFVTGNKWYAAILLALTTGAREGEILGLQWRNVNFRTNEIFIEQAVSKANVGYSIQDPKNESSVRKIELPQWVMDQLKILKEVIDEASGKVFNGRNDYVVHTSKGTFVQPPNLYKEYRKLYNDYCKMVELYPNSPEYPSLEYIKFHELRHTHVTWLLENDESIEAVAQRLGHSTSVTTMEYYSHVTKKMKSGIVRTLELAGQTVIQMHNSLPNGKLSS